MSWLKRLGKSQAVRRLAAAAAAGYLRLVHRTTRWRQEMPEETRALLDSGAPFIAAFWHGRMVMMRAAWPRRPRELHMLISEHADGQLIAAGMARLGFATIAGSSRRGGAAALREMARRLRGGDAVGITPDGPKGPRMRAKAGAVAAARAGGVPIVPISGAASRRRLLGTWDRFCLVLPFGRGLLLWGAPIAAEAAGDKAGGDKTGGDEAVRLTLERELNRLTAEADRRFGWPAVEPAPVQPAPHELKRAARGATAGPADARNSA